MSKKKRFQSVVFEIWQLLEDWEPIDQEHISVTLTGSSGRTITREKNRKTWEESQTQPNTNGIRETP